MNCRDAQDLIPLQAAGSAVREDSAQLEAHLQHCPHCRELMGDFTHVAAQLAIAVNPTPVPAVLREALDWRIDQSLTQLPPLKMPPQASRMGFSMALAASIALLMAIGVSLYIQHLQKTEIDGLHQLLASSENQNPKMMAHEATVVTAWENRVHLLQGRVRQADEAIKMLKVPHLQMASLVGAGKQRSAFGRLFWDQHAKMCTCCAADLKHLHADKTYELWWITPALKKIPAGTFNVDETGFALFTPTIPAGMKFSHAMTVAVTIEPAGGALHPQGPVELIGKL